MGGARGDGAVGSEGVVVCDASDAPVRPGASEAEDGVDDDCDGSIDEGVKTTYYRDADSDGYGALATSTTGCSAPASPSAA